jgi:membrane protease YdiL (CAAX protease family)
MNNIGAEPKTTYNSRPFLITILIILALAAFITIFVLVDNTYFKFANERFPNVGSSAWLASWWGVVSRAHLLILIIPLVLWQPRLFGFQIGRTRQFGRMLLIMLLVNCGIVAAYLLLTGSSTPYSGNQWFVTEVIIVPLVEETFWRGIVFTLLAIAFRQLYPEKTSILLAVWFSGVAFGLLHGNNILAGVPLMFVAIQVLNATLWGVVYGYARAKTESIYPSIFLHAAMNFIVILF